MEIYKNFIILFFFKHHNYTELNITITQKNFKYWNDQKYTSITQFTDTRRHSLILDQNFCVQKKINTKKSRCIMSNTFIVVRTMEYCILRLIYCL